MNHLDEKQVSLESFFQRFGSGSPILMLDYDGTLAPFHIDPMKAKPYPGVIERLNTIVSHQKTELILVTGRHLFELMELLPLDPHPEIWGCHGWESISREGKYYCRPLNESMKEGLNEAITFSEQSAYQRKIEKKPFCLALHWRGESQETKQEMEALFLPRWTEIADAHHLEVHPFDEGVELRPAGRSKGDVVDELISRSPKGPVAYLGDDFTDEDAFSQVKRRGLSVLVRKEWRPTAAAVHITPPNELISFLDQWIEAERRNK